MRKIFKIASEKQPGKILSIEATALSTCFLRHWGSQSEEISKTILLPMKIAAASDISRRLTLQSIGEWSPNICARNS
jgi:hypothetical protein